MGEVHVPRASIIRCMGAAERDGLIELSDIALTVVRYGGSLVLIGADGKLMRDLAP